MFKPKGPVCQSCGMPLAKDQKGGGTNRDGTLTAEYCSHCYQRGEFTDPNITAIEMVTLVKGKLKEMRIPGFLAWFFTKDIPNLKRWRK